MARAPKITGLKQALDALGKLPVDVVNKIQRAALRAGAKEVRAVVIDRVVGQDLVRTGRLRNSIKVRLHREKGALGGSTASIGSTLSRWHLAEFGTETQPARSYLRSSLGEATQRAKVAMHGVLKKKLVTLARKKLRGG